MFPQNKCVFFSCLVFTEVREVLGSCSRQRLRIQVKCKDKRIVLFPYLIKLQMHVSFLWTQWVTGLHRYMDQQLFGSDLIQTNRRTAAYLGRKNGLVAGGTFRSKNPVHGRHNSSYCFITHSHLINILIQSWLKRVFYFQRVVQISRTWSSPSQHHGSINVQSKKWYFVDLFQCSLVLVCKIDKISTQN